MKLKRDHLRAARAYVKACARNAAPIIAHVTSTHTFSEQEVMAILNATVDGHERVAALIKSWRRQAPLNPTQSKRQLLYDLLMRVEQALIGVSDYCREYHLQDCSFCDDLKCGDNTVKLRKTQTRRR